MHGLKVNGKEKRVQEVIQAKINEKTENVA